MASIFKNLKYEELFISTKTAESNKAAVGRRVPARFERTFNHFILPITKKDLKSIFIIAIFRQTMERHLYLKKEMSEWKTNYHIYLAR